MHVLLLPNLHESDSISLDGDGLSLSVASLPSVPKHALSLPLPGLRHLPSPFHLQLHVITKLSFNEHGRITRHRDFWDTRDLLGLLPGAKLVQWAGTRMVARGLSTAAWILGRRHTVEDKTSEAERGGVSGPVSVSVTNSPLREKVGMAALGQHYEDRSSGSSVNMPGTGLRSLFVAPRH